MFNDALKRLRKPRTLRPSSSPTRKKLHGGICKLCRSGYYKVVYSKRDETTSFSGDYKITDIDDTLYSHVVECLRCGLVYMLDHPDDDEIVRAYQDTEGDELYVMEEVGRRISARKLIQRIKKYKKDGKFLDIGCSTGFLLDEARKMGFDVKGLEVSKWAAGYAREKLNLPVEQNSINHADIAPESFDVIVMTDVIEHFAEPRDVLLKVRQILKPDGILCVTTPDINSLVSRLLRAKWWGIKNYHLAYFSKRTMKMMLNRTGFEIMYIGSYGRTFSLNYLIDRLGFYNSKLGKWIEPLLSPFDKHLLIPLNTKDQLEFFIKKKQSLKFQDHE